MSTLELFLFCMSTGEGYKQQAQAFVRVGASLGAVDLERECLIPGRTMVTSTLETISSEVKDAIKKELAEVRI